MYESATNNNTKLVSVLLLQANKYACRRRPDGHLARCVRIKLRTSASNMVIFRATTHITHNSMVKNSILMFSLNHCVVKNRTRRACNAIHGVKEWTFYGVPVASNVGKRYQDDCVCAFAFIFILSMPNDAHALLRLFGRFVCAYYTVYTQCKVSCTLEILTLTSSRLNQAFCFLIQPCTLQVKSTKYWFENNTNGLNVKSNSFAFFLYFRLHQKYKCHTIHLHKNIINYHKPSDKNQYVFSVGAFWHGWLIFLHYLHKMMSANGSSPGTAVPSW